MKKNIIKLKEDWKVEENKYSCPNCGKIFTKMGICSHIIRAHINTEDRFGKSREWMKGLTKETDERVAKRAEIFKNNLSSGATIHHWVGRKHSKETKEKISKALSKNNNGGKCKWYEISGIKVQGTWERDLTEQMNGVGIKWEKIKTNNFTFNYTKENKKHNYTPDFYLEEFDILLELKGYWWGDDKNKMKLVLEQNNILNLFIIEKELYKKLLNSKNKEEFINLITKEHSRFESWSP